MCRAGLVATPFGIKGTQLSVCEAFWELTALSPLPGILCGSIWNWGPSSVVNLTSWWAWGPRKARGTLDPWFTLRSHGSPLAW